MSKPDKLSAVNLKIIKASGIFVGTNTASEVYQEFMQLIRSKAEVVVIELTQSQLISQGGAKILKLIQKKADKLGIKLFVVFNSKICPEAL